MISLPVLLIGLFGIAMLILHAFRSSKRRIWITSADFFRVLPLKKARRSWAWAWPEPTKMSLWLRILALAAILMALLSVNSSILSRKLNRRLWIVVDVSASMSTRQAGQMRLDLAKSYAAELLDKALVQGKQVGDTPMVKLWAAHRSLQPITDLLSAKGAREALVDIEWQRRGTDWNAVAAMLNNASINEQQKPSLIVVVTDVPRSPGLRPPEGCLVTWCDVAESVNNRGFRRLQPVLDPFTGKLLRVHVDFVSYGDPVGRSSLLISTSYDGSPAKIPLDWKGLPITRHTIDDPKPGEYVLALEPDEDSYALDNKLVMTVHTQDNRDVVVDWRLDDRTWLDELGPAVTVSTEAPDVRVADLENVTDLSVPTLCTTSFPGSASALFGLFDEDSPLLVDVNLNSLEKGRLSSRLTEGNLRKWFAERGGNPASLATVLQDADDPAHVMLAVADDSRVAPVVFLAGLPQPGKEPHALSAVVLFWNAMQWLVVSGRQRAVQHLLEIGDRSDVEPRLPLEVEEGRTDHAGGPIPPVELALESAADVSESGLWRYLLLASAVFVAIERCGTIILGNDWTPRLPRPANRRLRHERQLHELRI